MFRFCRVFGDSVLKVRTLLFVVATVIAFAPRAFAQSGTSSKSVDDIRKDSKLRFGSIYFTPTFSLKDFGVDTNIFNQSGIPERDFTFTATPGVDSAFPISHRALVQGRTNLGLVYFRTHASERSVDPDLSVRVRFFTPHVDFFVSDGFLASRQRPNFEIDLRSRRTQNELAGGVDLKFSPRSSVELSVAKAIIRWDGDAVFLGSSLQTNLDRDEISYRAKLKSVRTPKTTLTLTTDVSHDRFRFAPARNTDIFRFLPGVEFAPRALISGSAQIGFKRFRTLSPALPNYSGLMAKLELGYTLLGSTRFVVATTRDVDYSYEQQQSFYIINSVGLSVRRQLFGGNDVIVAGETTRYSYQLAAPSQITDPRETTDSYSFDLGHRLQNQARFGFGVAHIRRGSRFGPGRDYEGWTFGLSFLYAQ